MKANIRYAITLILTIVLFASLSVGSTVAFMSDDGGLSSGGIRLVMPETTAATYTVSYDGNGGEGSPEPQTKIQGEVLILSTQVPLRDGYAFEGWSTDPAAPVIMELYAPGDPYGEDASVSLSAVWIRD